MMALLPLFAACDLMPIDEPGEGELFLTVGLPSDSKTYFGPSENNKRPTYWSNGDKLRLNGVVSDALSEIPDGSNLATFRFQGDFTAPYNVLYPSSRYVGPSTIILPQQQTFCNGGVGADMAPMSAQLASLSENGNLQHLCAFVGLRVLKAQNAGA
ncbi:MAG: hypothetical protein J5764_05830, partial [Bacteroidales bacterium]|nr:hypothetical protein [Bacteroidales bacterium]